MSEHGPTGDDEGLVAGVALPRSVQDLPDGGREAARATFGAAAALYDRGRPGYPSELFTDLASRAAITSSTRLVEIGCGTGQATRSLAGLGCSIRAIELGPELAAIARERLSGCTNVEVEVAPFEAAAVAPGSVDVVFAATSFHWIDPHLGFPRAAELLSADGTLALATNAQVGGGTQDEIAAEVTALQDQLDTGVAPWRFPSAEAVRARAQAGGDVAAVWSRVDRSFRAPPTVDHLFLPPVVTSYSWFAHYDVEGYLAMLGSQSSYLLLEPRQREPLFEGIAALVDERLGGRITKAYLSVLATARRAPG